MARASKTETDILRRVAEVGQERIAVVLNHDAGHISRIIKGERGLRLFEFEDFFAALGLRVVPDDGPLRSIPAWEYTALVRKAMAAYAIEMGE